MGGQILIKNGYLVTMDAELLVYDKGDILIEDDLIKEVGNFSYELVKRDAEIIDARGKIILPGFVNTHVHTSQQLGRGLGDDVPLITWLNERILPYENNLTEEDSYISTLLCILEQIRAGGVTTFAEAGGQHVNGMARAVSEAGIKGILAQSTVDCGEGTPKEYIMDTQEVLDMQESNLKKWHNRADGRIKVWFGLRTLFNNTDELIVRSKELADKHNVGVHMHVAEIPEENELRDTSTVNI